MFLGTKKLAENLTFCVRTVASTTGIATDADAAPAYRVYEEETAAPILTGTMAKLDDVNTTGFYTEQITVSGANGFEAGKSYIIYIEYAVAASAMTEVHHLEIREETEKDIFDRIGLNGAGLTALAQDADLTALIATVGVAGAGLTGASGDLVTTVGVAGAGLTALPDALLDKANGVETGYTLRQAMRLMAAMLCGKASGGPGGSVFRNLGDTANRLTSVADSDGNRTTMTATP